MLKRRRVFDRNNCEFRGRVVGDIVVSDVKGFDKQLIKRIDFTLAVNSNPWNANAVYFVHCYALKYYAMALEAKIVKGTHMIVYANYKPRTIAANKKLNREKSTQPFFEVNEFYIIRQPNEEKPINDVEFPEILDIVVDD